MTDFPCAAHAELCICERPDGHDGPHRCDNNCGAEWEGTWDGPDFKVVTFPTAFRRIFAGLFGIDPNPDDEEIA
jgi:hypothetical protein